MSAEVWRWVPGYEGRYEVSSTGSVRSHAGLKPRLLKPQIKHGGYPSVALWSHQKGEWVNIHRLMMRAFVGPAEGMVVRHLDGDPTNNTLPNLRYGTYAENAQDMLRHGRGRNQRKTACPAGHAYNDENTYLWRGWRRCRKCNAVGVAAYEARKRVAS